MHILRIYQWLNILSIDVAVGAVVCALYFVRLAQVQIRIEGLTVLGLTVWVIYTGDHLLDAQKIKSPASTLRHRFHQQYFFEILIALMFVLALIGVLLFFIRPEIFWWGVGLLSLVVVYMVLNRYLNYFKEMLIAVLYCGGVFLPVLAQSDSFSGFLFRPECILFLLLVLTNLLLFSWYEVDKDRKDGHQSFAVHFGKETTRKVIWILFILQVIIAIFLFYSIANLSLILPLLMMSLVLFFLLAFPKHFTLLERFRLLGDFVFLFPALVWVL